MSTNIYWIDVRHEGLHAYRRISGRDRTVVESKAEAQMAVWDEKWDKIQQRDRVLRSKEENKIHAAELTEEAEEAVEEIEDTLVSAIEQDPTFDWEQLKDTSRFDKAKPIHPNQLPYPNEPSLTDAAYEVKLTFWDRISRARRGSKENAARANFERDIQAWETKKKHIDADYAAAVATHKEKTKEWNAQKEAFLEAQRVRNAEIDAHRTAYLSMEAEAVVEYCDLVLTASEYPDSFPKSWRLDYNPTTRLLVADYSLPNLEALPKLKEARYVATRNEIVETNFSQTALEKMYDSLIYKISLRTIHEIFAADSINAIDAIVFNGWVNALDKATGLEVNSCIVSIQTAKQDFRNINLARVEPKACFKKLKGVGSSKLAALVPVRPILQLDTNDKRFVTPYEVVDQVDDSMNLAAMDWEDFEQLIREVFEKEFSDGSSEVKITRASRDGGVDAVVFDPDPLRGGKIVIQAKRYTNTVGVGWVRDLYGTVMNEGANKGILVTTADYGPDAYEFAKDKPLTLLSGSNLLHLLEKHGHQARIDLREAKLLQQNTRT